MSKPIPVKNQDGSLKESMLKIAGKSFRCSCGCNVFHQPDISQPNIYTCNGCDAEYEAVPKPQ